MKSTSGDYTYYYPPSNQQYYQPQPEMGFMFPIGNNLGMATQPAQTQGSYSLPQYGMQPNPYAGVYPPGAQTNNNMMPMNNNNASSAVEMTAHYVQQSANPPQMAPPADLNSSNPAGSLPSTPGRLANMSAPPQQPQQQQPQPQQVSMKGQHMGGPDLSAGGMYWPDAALHARLMGNPPQASAQHSAGPGGAMSNLHGLPPAPQAPHQNSAAGLNDLILAAMMSNRNNAGLQPPMGSTGPTAQHISAATAVGGNQMFAPNAVPPQPPSSGSLPGSSNGPAPPPVNTATANALAALAALGVTPPGAPMVGGASPFDLNNSTGPSVNTVGAGPGAAAYMPSQPSSMVTNGGVMEQTESQQFRVAKRHCGRIIGKGGVRIRELEEKHQCKIQVHSQEPPVNGCISITVTGTSWSRSQCWTSIQEIIRESERREQQQPGGGSLLSGSMFESAGFGAGHSVAPLLGTNDMSMGPVAMTGNSLMGGPTDVAATGLYDPAAANGYNTWSMGGLHAPSSHLNDFTALMNMAAAGNNTAPNGSQFEGDLVSQFGNMVLHQHQGQPPQIRTQYRTQTNSYFNSSQQQNFNSTNSRRKAPTDPAQYPIIKRFYNEDPALAALTPVQRKEMLLRQNNLLVCGITQDPSKVYPYIIPSAVEEFLQAFRDYPDILESIARQKFYKPTPIQCIAWPVLLSGLDFIGVAQTGSGKTLAYLLPALVHLEGQTKPRANRAGPSVLILAPTRELTQQIQAEVLRYPFRNVRCVAIYGGAHRSRQIMDLQKLHPEIVVSTPGRLNDLLNEGKIDLSDVTYCVLDEADRMLDMGFEPQVVQILAPIRKDRQTVMTTATWSQPIDNLAQKYMQDPVRCNVGTLELNVCRDVQQLVEHVREEQRWQWLYSFLMCQFQASQHKALIFVSRKLDCSQMAQMLSQMPTMPPTACIHGDMDQSAREEALELLRSGQVRILVATDVASRGLDIHDITHVINFDAPKNAEEYIHRVGRTGRAGRIGMAITLLTENDGNVARQIMSVMEQTMDGSGTSTLSAGNFSGRGDNHNRRRGGNNNYQYRQANSNMNSTVPMVTPLPLSEVVVGGGASASPLMSVNGCPSGVVSLTNGSVGGQTGSGDDVSNGGSLPSSKHRNNSDSNNTNGGGGNLMNGSKLLNGGTGVGNGNGSTTSPAGSSPSQMLLNSATNGNGNGKNGTVSVTAGGEFGGVFDPSLV